MVAMVDSVKPGPQEKPAAALAQIILHLIGCCVRLSQFPEMSLDEPVASQKAKP